MRKSWEVVMNHWKFLAPSFHVNPHQNWKQWKKMIFLEVLSRIFFWMCPSFSSDSLNMPILTECHWTYIPPDCWAKSSEKRRGEHALKTITGRPEQKSLDPSLQQSAILWALSCSFCSPFEPKKHVCWLKFLFLLLQHVSIPSLPSKSHFSLVQLPNCPRNLRCIAPVSAFQKFYQQNQRYLVNFHSWAPTEGARQAVPMPNIARAAGLMAERHPETKNTGNSSDNGVYRYTPMCAYIHAYTFIYIYIHIYIHTYMYIHIYIYIFTYMYIYMYIYKYIYMCIL